MSQASTNPAAYAEALAAADGYNVMPIAGADVKPDMELRYDNRWLKVQYKSVAGDFIRLDFQMDQPGATEFAFTSPADELYRRVPIADCSPAQV